MPRLRTTLAEVVPPPVWVGLACAAALAACGEPSGAPPPSWSTVVESPEAALLSVSGTSAADVWMVGADSDNGPLVLHWDAAVWRRVPTGTRGHLWWIHAFSANLVFAGGAGG